MGNFFAYARVSTPRQGEKGVSLTEQKAAIERYAQAHDLEISRWFEERESASQQGRPAFTEMLRLLRRGAAQGVIIHKIDRSARNLDDWADIEKLVDLGIDVRFATENVDLRTVAGRLTADIQAVVATHYSRNLREEVKKGLYGRLKQGFYPFRAPVGYLDRGSATPKTPDPATAPMVRMMFELYATGQWSLPQLVREVDRRGFRNRTGARVTLNGAATILRNPFYIGLMRIIKTGEAYAGSHEPLVSTEVFERVQAVLNGKCVDRTTQHTFRFSRIARCATCLYSLIAETHKGHVYYRCHNRPFKSPQVCPPTSVREEALDTAVLNALADIDLRDEELALARLILDQRKSDAQRQQAQTEQSYRIQLDRIESHVSRLTDLFMDGTIDQTLFTNKQNALLMDRTRLREKLAETEHGLDHLFDAVKKIVELAKSPSILYRMASPPKKRELLKSLLSNVSVSGKSVGLTLALPFRLIAERQKTPDGRPYRGSCRTWENTIQELMQHFINLP